ncbi:MAG TPA: efflux RND transporter periplasmic adaptor subunit [Hyphomicrobiales bacterium]|nr:efflux RND transporter periplasmic adaptor subunit [Hyphomicrobiales bacterium]
MPNSLAAFLSACFLLLTAGNAAADEFPVEPISVTVMKSVFGQVQSRDVLRARARIGGTIVEIAVEEGDQVAAGEVIASVVDEKLALQLDALDARIKAVSAQLDNAQTNLGRGQELFSRGTIPKSRLDELQTQADVLSNELNAVRAERSVVVQQSEEGAVEAPASGRILRVPVSQGSVILPGETVATIAGGGYFLRLSLPERHAGGISEGDQVAVGRRGLVPDQTEETSLTGRIAKVYPEIEDGRVLADVEVEGLGDFFVGERTLVSIPIGTRQAIAVPPEAVVTRHGLDYVTILHDGAPAEVAVIPGEVLATEAGPRIEILTGLEAGDTVVLP